MTDGIRRDGADGGEPAAVALGAPIEELAAELEDVERGPAGPGTVEYRRAGVAFAARDGNGLAFRLRPEVVDAALRTPDTRRSARGYDWVELAPTAVDTFTLDRALAWFESAWRLAGEPPEREPRARPH